MSAVIGYSLGPLTLDQIDFIHGAPHSEGAANHGIREECVGRGEVRSDFAHVVVRLQRGRSLEFTACSV
jgi:hypothetical protein